MEFEQKRLLTNVVYYSLIAVMIAFEVFLMINLAPASMAVWEKICLYVLAFLLALIALYDLIISFSSKAGTNKYINGFILYGATLAVVIISLVIFALNSNEARLFTELSERFFRIILMLYIINAITIAIYLIGRNILNMDNKPKTKINRN